MGIMAHYKWVQSDPMLPMCDYWTNDTRFTGKRFCEFEHTSSENELGGIHIHLWVPKGTPEERIMTAGTKIMQNHQLKNTSWSWSYIPSDF